MLGVSDDRSFVCAEVEYTVAAGVNDVYVTSGECNAVKMRCDVGWTDRRPDVGHVVIAVSVLTLDNTATFLYVYINIYVFKIASAAKNKKAVL